MTVLVHTAELQLAPGADPGAPGAAVTVALCGHWEHEAPCRLPHLTESVDRGSGRVAVRTRVLAPDGDHLDDVRRLVAAALRGGRLDGPTGRSDWQVVADAPEAVTVADRAWAARQRQPHD